VVVLNASVPARRRDAACSAGEDAGAPEGNAAVPAADAAASRAAAPVVLANAAAGTSTVIVAPASGRPVVAS
jgi:hypothetical protein